MDELHSIIIAIFKISIIYIKTEFNSFHQVIA